MNRSGKIHTRVLAENPWIREFHKNMDRFAGFSPWNVYTDFLQLAICAFLSDRTPEHPREKLYLQILGKYKSSPGAPERFAEMLACVMMYMRETGLECLSDLWEEYAANEQLGQFFTPWSVCRFMTEFNLHNIDWEKFSPDRPCGISDPTCGGGRLLVAALKTVPHGKLGSVFCHGIDIDRHVCNVAALNMLFFNANSYIVHGNALTLEVWNVFRTEHHFLGGRIVEITNPEEQKKIMEIGFQTVEKTKPAEPQKLCQMELF